MVINDGGTMKLVAVTAMTTYIESNASFASKGFATAMSIALQFNKQEDIVWHKILNQLE